MRLSTQPIAVFDSGVGGLTVLKELVKQLPNETFIYLGDTARVPYGNKSKNTVLRYSNEITQYLLEKKIKLLVVACNTISALALEELRQLSPIPMLGVIEPGAFKAVSTTSNNRVAVLGTKATIQSGIYQNAIKKMAPQIHVIPIACPLFVPLVEEQWLTHPATYMIAIEYLKSLQRENVDTVLLGCTHYPLLKPLLQGILGDKIKIVDSASTCAEQVDFLLTEQQLLSTHRATAHQYFVSDDPIKFRSLAEKLFQHPIDTVEIFSIEPNLASI